MKNKIYMESGYVNIPWILSLGLPYNFIVGTRGCGKTYTALKTVIETINGTDEQMLFMRRLKNQADLVCNPALSPFAKLNRNENLDIGAKPIPRTNISGLYHSTENEEGEWVVKGKPIGFAIGLNVIASVRGFDADRIQYTVFDEFIAETSERTIKNEGQAFVNAYETINRNRELDGRKPMQCLLLANSNRLDNPILSEFGLIDRAYKMMKSGVESYIDRKSGIALFMLMESPITSKKRDTALYKAVNKDSRFYKMAIENAFDYNDSAVHSRNLTEYKPIVCLTGHFCVYEHKSNSELYVSRHVSGSMVRYESDAVSQKRFTTNYDYLYDAYIENAIVFESVDVEEDFKAVYKFTE